MKKVVGLLLCTLVLLLVAGNVFAADTYDTAKKRGSMICGVKDSTPLAYVDQKTRQIVGYDIDFCAAVAKKLGVKLEVKPVTSASRMPQLMEGNIDMIAATMTKNAERAKQIDFSHSYFLTGQKFLVKKGTVKSLQDLDGKKIGTRRAQPPSRMQRRRSRNRPFFPLTTIRRHSWLCSRARLRRLPRMRPFLRDCMQRPPIRPSLRSRISRYLMSRTGSACAGRQEICRFCEQDASRNGKERRSQEDLRQMVRSQVGSADAAHVQDCRGQVSSKGRIAELC